MIFSLYFLLPQINERWCHLLRRRPMHRNQPTNRCAHNERHKTTDAVCWTIAALDRHILIFCGIWRNLIELRQHWTQASFCSGVVDCYLSIRQKKKERLFISDVHKMLLSIFFIFFKCPSNLNSIKKKSNTHLNLDQSDKQCLKLEPFECFSMLVGEAGEIETLTKHKKIRTKPPRMHKESKLQKLSHL